MVRAVDGGESGDSGNSVGYTVPAVPLPAIVGKPKEGELEAAPAHADDSPTALITDRFNALANTALDVVSELMVGEHSRGASTRLAACSTILDRVSPRKGVATPGVAITANQLAVIVQAVPPSTLPPPSTT